MANLSPDFHKSAGKREKPKSKHPSPFSLRLTYEERARLEQKAGGKSLGAYIREQLLGDDVSPRKRRQVGLYRTPKRWGVFWARLALRSCSATSISWPKPVILESLPVTPETELGLWAACQEVRVLRKDLMKALGKSPEDGP